MGLLAGRIVLGAVFGVAGAAKLADRAGTGRALRDFGVPARFAAPGAVPLALSELALAAAVLVGPWARPAAAGASVLLVAFSAAVARNLAAGRRVDCHCFGRLLSSSIGAGTLVRNGLLAVLSLVVVVDRPSAVATGAVLAALAVVAGWRIGATRPAAPPASTPDPENSARPPESAAQEPAAGRGALSRRRVLTLLGLSVVGAALGVRPAQANACGGECRKSSDCPGTCTGCLKRPGEMTGHCH